MYAIPKNYIDEPPNRFFFSYFTILKSLLNEKTI